MKLCYNTRNNRLASHGGLGAPVAFWDISLEGRCYLWIWKMY